MNACELNAGRKVAVYRNLHKNCWSVKCMKSKKVIAHLDHIFLERCKLKVSEAGRQRVLKERRKNVHAMVVGFIAKNIVATDTLAYYNPYKVATFVDKNQNPVLESSFVELDFPYVFCKTKQEDKHEEKM